METKLVSCICCGKHYRIINDNTSCTGMCPNCANNKDTPSVYFAYPVFTPVPNPITKKLRLIFTTKCNRNCPGCCNKNYDLDNLPVCKDFSPYDEIYITGGEPMLNPIKVAMFCRDLQQVYPNIKLYMYTAYLNDPNNLINLIYYLDGITLTLHTAQDIAPFYVFEQALKENIQGDPEYFKSKTFYLNIFKEVGHVEPSKIWTRVKKDMVWIENCPLPEGEILMKYDYKRGVK